LSAGLRQAEYIYAFIHIKFMKGTFSADSLKVV